MPAAAIAGVAGLLTVAFFPLYFDRAAGYDDEGSLLVALQRFLQHGSLYDHTHGSYGPFYFTVNGAIFKIIGDPTPFKGRLIVLLITALTVAMFAATVWRVTRSVMLSILCEVATFVVLIPDAGRSPMHPGAFIALLVAVLAYELVSYTIDHRHFRLIVTGVALGGILMMKINVGIFAIAAVVVAFVVGNPRYPRWARRLVAIGAVVLPFAVTFQRLYLVDTAQFAVLVSFSMLCAFVPLSVDEARMPARVWVPIGGAVVATMLVSFVWPLLTGTSPLRLFTGVFVQPLRQADHLAFEIHPDIVWLAIVLTLAVLYLVMVARRREPDGLAVRPAWLLDAGLALAALVVLGLGLFGGIAAWLPAIVLLPALAYVARSQRKVRLALRFLVPLSIFQMLHAYPVPGAQTSWGLVAMSVPCVIALWAGVRALPAWRTTTTATRVIVGTALCIVVIVGAGQWPGQAWHDYLDQRPLRLRGTSLIRLDSDQAADLRQLTKLLQRRCDTFYSAPGYASLYIYTGLPTPTGQLANFPGALNDREQRDIASQLAELEQQGKRVCIVRNEVQFPRWLDSSYGRGPLGKAVAQYKRRIGRPVGDFTVSRLGRAPQQSGS